MQGNIGMDGPLVIGPADVDVYSFIPATSQYVDIRTQTSMEGSAKTNLRVFDAIGNQLTANGDRALGIRPARSRLP